MKGKRVPTVRVHELSCLGSSIGVVGLSSTRGSSFVIVLGELYCIVLYCLDVCMTDLGEVANHVAATRVKLCHDVEEEWLHSKVEGLVLQKEFCHEAQALAVHFVFLSVHLEHRSLAVPVDLSAWRVLPHA